VNISFEGRTALVTGAGHGFGRAIAGAFAKRGARVFACDVNADALAETGNVVGEACDVSVVDVTNRDMVQAWVRSALDAADVWISS